MAQSLAELKYEIAVANRICANEGVVDAFGHVSARHPDNPNRYFLSRSRAPELIEPSDIYEFDLDSVAIGNPSAMMYSERVIHGEIYKARPDVMAVCHHHSPAILSYCITGEKLLPVYHLGAVIGHDVPFWDQRDEFGDTNLLVRFPEEGASLARALGKQPLVLMNRHGATVVGDSLRQLVFRTIYSCRNAEYQTRAKSSASSINFPPAKSTWREKSRASRTPSAAPTNSGPCGSRRPAGRRRAAGRRYRPRARARQRRSRQSESADKTRSLGTGTRPTRLGQGFCPYFARQLLRHAFLKCREAALHPPPFRAPPKWRM